MTVSTSSKRTVTLFHIHTSYKTPVTTWSLTPQSDLPPPTYITENTSHHMVTHTSVGPSSTHIHHRKHQSSHGHTHLSLTFLHLHTSEKTPVTTWSLTPQSDLPPPTYITENTSHHMVTHTSV